MRNAQQTKKRSKPDYVPSFESEEGKIESKRHRQEEKDDTHELGENVAMELERDTERISPQPFQPRVSAGIATRVVEREGISPPPPPQKHKHAQSGRGHRPPLQAYGIDAVSPEDGGISPLLLSTARTATPLVAIHREAPAPHAHASTRVKRPTLEHEVRRVEKAEDEHVKPSPTVSKALKNRLVVLVVLAAATVVAAVQLVLWWSSGSRVAHPARRHLGRHINDAHAEPRFPPAPQAAVDDSRATAAPMGVQTELGVSGDRLHRAADPVTATLEGDINAVADDHATSNLIAAEDAHLTGASLGGDSSSVEGVGAESSADTTSPLMVDGGVRVDEEVAPLVAAVEATTEGLQGTGLRESDGLRGVDMLIVGGERSGEKEGSAICVAALQLVMPYDLPETVAGAAVSVVAEGIGAGEGLILHDSIAKIAGQSAMSTVTDHEAAAVACIEVIQQQSGPGRLQEAHVPPVVHIGDGCVVVRGEELSMMVAAGAEQAVVTTVETGMRQTDGRDAEELNACVEHEPGEPDRAITVITQSTHAQNGDARVELAGGRERGIGESVKQTVSDHTPEGAAEQQQTRDPVLPLAAELGDDSMTSDGLDVEVVLMGAGVMRVVEGAFDVSLPLDAIAAASQTLADDKWVPVMPELRVDVDDAKEVYSAETAPQRVAPLDDDGVPRVGAMHTHEALRVGASNLGNKASPISTSVDLSETSPPKVPAVRSTRAAAHGVIPAEALSAERGTSHEPHTSAGPAHAVEHSNSAVQPSEARSVSLVGASTYAHAELRHAVMFTGAIVDVVGIPATPTDIGTAGGIDTRQTMWTEMSKAPSAVREVSGASLQVNRCEGHTSFEITGMTGLTAAAYTTMSTASECVDHLSKKGAGTQSRTSSEEPAVMTTAGTVTAASLRSLDGASVPDAVAVEGAYEVVGRAVDPVEVPAAKAQLHDAHQADRSAVAEDTALRDEASISTTGECLVPPVADASQRGPEALLATEDGGHGTGPAAAAEAIRVVLPVEQEIADEDDVLMTPSWRKRRARVPRSDSTDARVAEGLIGAQQPQQEAIRGAGDHPDEWAILGLLNKLDYHALHLHHMGYELLIAGMAAAIAGGVVLVTFEFL